MARKRRFFKKIIGAYLAIGNEHCLRVSRLKMHGVRRQQVAHELVQAADPIQGDDGTSKEITAILNNGSTPLPPEPGREADDNGGILATILNGDHKEQVSSDASRKADDEVAPLLASMILPGSSDSTESPAQSREATVTGDHRETSGNNFTFPDLDGTAIGGNRLTFYIGQGGENAAD